jgi:hypothetical protein
MLGFHNGPHTTVYVHEIALRHVVGDVEVMRDQLLHLALLHGWPHATMRVIPTTARSHPALLRPATLLTLPDPQRPLAYTETDTATVFHDDPRLVARFQDKMHHLDRLALTAEESGTLLTRCADAYERRIR